MIVYRLSANLDTTNRVTDPVSYNSSCNNCLTHTSSCNDPSYRRPPNSNSADRNNTSSHDGIRARSDNYVTGNPTPTLLLGCRCNFRNRERYSHDNSEPLPSTLHNFPPAPELFDALRVRTLFNQLFNEIANLLGRFLTIQF